MAMGVYSLTYGFSKGSLICVLFPEEQYIYLVGLVKGKTFFQFVVSNPSSDVQKLFLVIRDGSSNIMYK